MNMFCGRVDISRRPMSLLLVLVLLEVLLCSLPGAAAAATPSNPAPGSAVVGSAQELFDAMSDPSVSTISVIKPFAMPHGDPTVEPVLVQRNLLISSPHRAMIDWCDKQCRAGKMRKEPFIILGKGAMVTFNRLFFKNFVPNNSSAVQEAALDFAHSPVPWVVSKDGGRATYNLVVMHWSPPMFWVFNQTGTYWKEAAAADIEQVGATGIMLQLKRPELYVIKSFTTDASTATIMDCYMPVDVNSCLSDQSFRTSLVYCPYTFKDSLKNPYLDTVMVFHNIGLDRLVNSYRNPAVVDRQITYVSCPGTRQIMDLDNITSSVLVTAGGSLTFQNMVIQGSKSQNRTDWPSSIPLLLSTFKPVESGTVILRDSTVRVRQMDDLIMALSKLPQGSSSAVEIPDLQPSYGSNKPPQQGTKSFQIKSWQLQRQRWMLTKTGGSTIMDRMSASSSASWQMFNVSVESYTDIDCFGAAVIQGSLLKGHYKTVTSGSELLEQLGNATARYIRVGSDITLPANLGMRHTSVNRIVEIRACSDGPAYVVDWAGNDGAIMVAGNAIWEGNMAFKDVGWSESTLESKKEVQLVDALHPTGTGVIEYEDLTLLGEIPESGWQPDGGKTSMTNLLGMSDLEDQPANVSVLAPNKLLLRGLYINRSRGSSNIQGLESFLDVTLCWHQAAPSGSDSGSLSSVALAAAVAVPICVALLLGSVAACMWRKRSSRPHAPAGKDINDFGGKPGILPLFIKRGGDSPGDGSSRGSPGGAPVIAAVKAGSLTALVRESEPYATSGGAIGVGPERQASGTSSLSGTNRSKAQSGFSDNIAQACKSLAATKSVGRDAELVLESVLGEGSYGKVFKATWRGTVVAVKIMVLPSHMSGKEKREKMAVMETAISSSLSHPNCVATYTYAVEPVRSNTTLKEHSEAEGPGAGMSMHDSSQSWRAGGVEGSLAGLRKGSSSSSADAGAFSWEVRLVQEYCDLGSLRSAFKQNRFKSTSGAVLHMNLAETALDVARAMTHLHKHNIVHSDLKARNVLLRSDMQDPRGFTAKVADFGLSLTIDPNSTHISNAFQGTMTHMAPETLMQGHISKASDVFGFGILMWELYTGEHAYKGVPRALLGHNITKQGMRPVFPPETPFEWQFLACRCWESDPAIRPTFDQILEELTRIRGRWSTTMARPNSIDGSAANTGPTTPRSHGSTCGSDSVYLQTASRTSALDQQQHAQQQQQQQPWMQQVGQLPCIQDISDTLPSTDILQQHHSVCGAIQQPHAGVHCADPQYAAACHLDTGVARRAQQGAAANSRRPQQQPSQPLSHMCFESQSKDALVLLSDCDTTMDSYRPS